MKTNKKMTAVEAKRVIEGALAKTHTELRETEGQGLFAMISHGIAVDMKRAHLHMSEFVLNGTLAFVGKRIGSEPKMLAAPQQHMLEA